jgi:hypothetical protein
MGTAFQFVFRVTRIIAISICLFVLIASLVMWPRSLFYIDYVGIPFTAGKFPLIQTAGSLGGTTIGGYPCLKSMSGHIAIIGTGPRPYGEFTSTFQAKREHVAFAVPSSTSWFPQYFATRPVLLLPYWLTAFVAIVGLMLCVPFKTLRGVYRSNGSITDLLIITLSVALVIAAAQLIGHADAVILGEVLVLAIVIVKTLGPRKLPTERRSGIERGVGFTALAGTCAAIAFAIFTHVGYSTWFVPLADF